MSPLILALLLMQVTAPATASSAPPGWTAAPLDDGVLNHYTRTESDGSVGTLIVRRQVCDCQPDVMSDMIEQALRKYPNVTVVRDSLQVCGQKALRTTVTGLASPPDKKNMVVIAFRSGDAIVSQQYIFTQPQPAADAITTLEGLCP